MLLQAFVLKHGRFKSFAMDSLLNIRAFDDARSQGRNAAASSSSRASDMREMETLLDFLVEADKSMTQLPLSPCTPPDDANLEAVVPEDIDEHAAKSRRVVEPPAAKSSTAVPGKGSISVPGSGSTAIGAVSSSSSSKASISVPGSGSTPIGAVSRSSSSRPTTKAECKLLSDLLTMQQGSPCKVFPKEAPPSKAPGPRWPSRQDLRAKGHGKGDRRRGGSRAAWFSAMHKLKRENPDIQWSAIIAELGGAATSPILSAC